MAWPAQDSCERVALLRRLIDGHAAALELYARQWCEDAEDVVQECLVKFASQPRPPDNAAAWLFRAVRNRAISAGRSATRRRRHESAAAEQRQPWFVMHNGQALDATAAADGLRSLPIEEREVIVAHLWGGLSFEQVAQVVGCSSSTAHRRYLAGLETLRERLRVK